MNYVTRTQQPRILANARQDPQFGRDSYIQARKPFSVLLMPLFLRGQLTQMLYLENNLTKAAFSEDRLNLLSLLSSHAAMALENARLYTLLHRHSLTLSQEVEKRTAELVQATRAKSTFISTMSHEVRTE